MVRPIVRHLRVWQDQEPFCSQALNDGIRHLLRRQDAIDTGGAALLHAANHLCRYRLRAQGCDLYPVIPMGNGQRLGKANRRMFGGRVGGVSDLIQQSRGRDRVEEKALSTLKHAGQAGAGSVDMRHHVNFPHGLPGAVGGGGRPPGLAVAGDNAGIAAKQVDAAITAKHLIDHGLDGRFVADIDLKGFTGNRCRHCLRASAIEVGDDHFFRALTVEAFTQGLADAVAATGDDHNPSLYLHQSISLANSSSTAGSCTPSNMVPTSPRLPAAFQSARRSMTRSRGPTSATSSSS